MKKTLAILLVLIMVVCSIALYACDKSVKKSFTITWQNWDGTVLEVDENVPKGTTPQFDGETPTKASDENYDYKFLGWFLAVMPAQNDTTYTAQFYSVPKRNTNGLGIDIDPSKIAYEAGMKLIEEFVPNGKAITTAIGFIVDSFIADDKGKTTPLDEIKDDIASLRAEIAAQYQQIESQLNSLSQSLVNIGNRIETVVVAQTTISNKPTSKPPST